mmetsp:Transcript_4084/g.3414  ORF Transcript_4084/g.3414 Transcript_4084/m.3414 type:complete len:111 (+) Transcript_4084:330-662(+)
MIDSSTPFGELMNDSCENPQSDVYNDSIKSDKSTTIEPTPEEEIKYNLKEASSPKFGPKVIDFNTSPTKQENPLSSLLKKKSLSTIEEQSFDVSIEGGTARSNKFNSLVS